MLHTAYSPDPQDFDPDDNFEVHFNHNGDYSGKVLIVVPADKVTVWTVTDGPLKGMAEVTVPFEALKDLVAEWVRSNLISQAEQAAANELLLGVD